MAKVSEIFKKFKQKYEETCDEEITITCRLKTVDLDSKETLESMNFSISIDKIGSFVDDFLKSECFQNKARLSVPRLPRRNGLCDRRTLRKE